MSILRTKVRYVFDEELTMEVGAGSSGSNAQQSMVDEEERDLESDSYIN